ncbi:sigma-70 family RNA polymerase sigma factor [Indioceanicola profundi]|uniref:sigma-70 family RNA polymerase sigma factor n=1 Tax=Indioceanicola profundi TaxID=2220096 RepID=UPI003850A36A
MDEADDLVQDSLVRALSRRDLFEPGTNLRSWLLTIMHNVHANEVRRRVARPDPVDVDSLKHKLGYPSTQDDRVLLRDVVRGLAALPKDQRRVVLLVAIAGLKYEEVARVVDVPPGTVMSRVSRARDTLRRRLTPEEETVGA